MPASCPWRPTRQLHRRNHARWSVGTGGPESDLGAFGDRQLSGCRRAGHGKRHQSARVDYQADATNGDVVVPRDHLCGSELVTDDQLYDRSEMGDVVGGDVELAIPEPIDPENLAHEVARIVVAHLGCGDAVIFEQFLSKGSHISGMDISAERITWAKQRLSRRNCNPDLASVGGVPEITHLEKHSLDAILSFNVLAYLTDDDEDLFYKQSYRLLRPGGYLIVTHSNELFDMYSFNQYTIEFFDRHLVTDNSLRPSLQALITNASEEESIVTYNVRENPLTYRFKLARYGFVEQRQEFINLHTAPPPLLPKDKSYPDTLSRNEEDKWKLMFTCSIFGSRAIRK